jgi:hypothetical protein
METNENLKILLHDEVVECPDCGLVYPMDDLKGEFQQGVLWISKQILDSFVLELKRRMSDFDYSCRINSEITKLAKEFFPCENGTEKT